MGALASFTAALMGRRAELPETLADRHPELRRIRLRRGGLPVRVGGWALGQRTVAAITLWRTVFVAPGVALEAELLLHELRHVHQFEASTVFPIRYLWESVRRGYRANRYETDARTYAAAQLRASMKESPRGDV
ncbi:MAG TPA: hypothetical protein VIP79_04055 [Gemmatimonadaceae bacterium]